MNFSFFRPLIWLAALTLPTAHAATLASSSTPVAAIFAHTGDHTAQRDLFLRLFPKGADLHNHLAGAIFAENMLNWAAQRAMCVSIAKNDILDRPCKPGVADEIPAATLITRRPDLESQVIDALSMRDFVPTATDRSGHDHFFATFDHFQPINSHFSGEMLAEAIQTAARDHVTYLELMISPAIGSAIGHGMALPPFGTDFNVAHKSLAPFAAQFITQAQSATDSMEHRAREILHCDSATPDAACAVTVRYLFQTLRTLPPNAVFAQLDLGYALVKADARFVGLNIVAPEDNPIAMRDYALHMSMFHFLNGVMPGVNLSLHAGELTPNLVPPNGLKDHIRSAIEVAGAKRIGHGVDIAEEDNASDLLAQMAQQHIMVEINLTSNDEILGVSGAEHPFMLYRQAGVPVALSTDDEGISRGDLTAEYTRAASTYHLSYPELVVLARTGLEYAFLPGPSLWVDHHLGQIVAPCAQANDSNLTQYPACSAFLQRSLHARTQWAYEVQRISFENNLLKNPLFNGNTAQ